MTIQNKKNKKTCAETAAVNITYIYLTFTYFWKHLSSYQKLPKKILRQKPKLQMLIVFSLMSQGEILGVYFVYCQEFLPSS